MRFARLASLLIDCRPIPSSHTAEPSGLATGFRGSLCTPAEVVELGDLLTRHAEAGIELRVVPRLLPIWHQVIESSVAFSGIRLRNLDLRAEALGPTIGGGTPNRT